MRAVFMSFRFLRCSVGVAVMAANLAACSGSSPQGSSTTAPLPSVPAPPSSASVSPDKDSAARSAALTAYREMWRAYDAAGSTTNPLFTELARFADGDALRSLEAGLESDRKQGLVGRGEVVPHPTVASLLPAAAPDTAGIVDCLDTSGAIRVRVSPSGAPFTDSPGGRRRVIATVKQVKGAWKVISLAPMAVGTC